MTTSVQRDEVIKPWKESDRAIAWFVQARTPLLKGRTSRHVRDMSQDVGTRLLGPHELGTFCGQSAQSVQPIEVSMIEFTLLTSTVDRRIPADGGWLEAKMVKVSPTRGSRTKGGVHATTALGRSLSELRVQERCEPRQRVGQCGHCATNGSHGICSWHEKSEGVGGVIDF